MKPHTNPRNGVLFFFLGIVLLAHSLLSSFTLFGTMLLGTLPPLWIPLLLWCGAAYAVFGWAYLRGVTSIFGKRANGTLNMGRLLLLLPIHGQNYLGILMVRGLSCFTVFHEVAPCLYPGGIAFAGDAHRLRKAGVFAVLDLTAEFIEPKPLRSGVLYHCLPLLDATAPTLDELEVGARWIQQACERGETVYVHCAKGAGRSAMFAAAYLILSGQAKDAREAVEQLRARRTHAKLVGAQAAVLSHFTPAENAINSVVR